MTEPLVALLEAAVRLAVPILLVALGELIVERAGVVNIGVEGMMLGGCLAAAVASHGTGSPWVALATALFAGVCLACVFAAIALIGGADAIVTGAGLNLFAAGATGFLYRALYVRGGGALEVTTFAAWSVPGLSDLPVIGRAFFSQPAPTYLAYAAVLVVVVTLRRTGLGLRLRAAGEEPRALYAAGTDVIHVRVGAVLVGGAFAGLGGAALVLAHAGTFVEGMTAGRGFIALALVICAGWQAGWILGVSVLFGFALALQFQLQALGWDVPYQLVRMVPYVATLAVLAIAKGAILRAPASLGQSYRRQ